MDAWHIGDAMTPSTPKASDTPVKRFMHFESIGRYDTKGEVKIGTEVVKASDYDALERENTELRALIRDTLVPALVVAEKRLYSGFSAANQSEAHYQSQAHYQVKVALLAAKGKL